MSNIPEQMLNSYKQLKNEINLKNLNNVENMVLNIN